MRNWLFHPIIFYPLAILFSALVIVVSLEPQSWPREPRPVAGEQDGEWLVFQRQSFDAPANDENQELSVQRDYFGRAEALRIAQKPSLPRPAATEDGARLLLSARDAAVIAGRRVALEVSYNPLPVNAATGLAISMRGAEPSPWITQPAPPRSATLLFETSAPISVNAIGLRALTTGNDQAYGLEITRIRIRPLT